MHAVSCAEGLSEGQITNLPKSVDPYSGNCKVGEFCFAGKKFECKEIFKMLGWCSTITVVVLVRASQDLINFVAGRTTTKLVECNEGTR